MNEDQAYQGGQDAFEAGTPITDCPHRPSIRAPHLYDCWAQGWLDAKAQNKPALFPGARAPREAR